MVVDDCEPVARALARLLSKRFEVVVTTGCDEAIRLLGTNLNLTAIISDFDLGEVRDGLWLLSQARALRPHARRILMSGSYIVSLEELDRAGVVDRFFPKPVDVDSLWSVLEPPRATDDAPRAPSPPRSRPR